MLSRNDLQKLSVSRLEDAIILYQAGRSSSAYYIAGYSIELALKACISKLFLAETIPDKELVNSIYVHKLDKLLNVSGLLPEYQSEAKTDSQFAAYWGIASKWSEQSRYELTDSVTAATLIQSINDRDHGVLKWLKKHW